MFPGTVKLVQNTVAVLPDTFAAYDQHVKVSGLVAIQTNMLK